MSEPTQEDEKIIYPLIVWRAALDDDGEICSVEFLFARNQQEAQAAASSGELLGVALGMSAAQCRVLGADLIDAANKLRDKWHPREAVGKHGMSISVTITLTSNSAAGRSIRRFKSQSVEIEQESRAALMVADSH